jgi:UDP-glucose 4-epimerase
MTAQRFLVVGGAGFLGKRVVDRLRAAGHQVAVFDSVRMTADGYFAGDITRMESLWEGFKIARPETVIQLAYLLGPESKQQPYLASQVNVNGMTNVFEASRLAGGVGRVVYASSVTVHGLQRTFGIQPVNEDSPTVPVGPYAAMKLFNEQMAATFADRYGVEMVGIRFSNLVGHGRSTGSSGPWAGGIISRPAVGQPIDIPVSPHFRASMLYVEDAAEYVTRIATSSTGNPRVLLTGGYDLTVAQLSEAVRAVIPGAGINFGASDPDMGDDVPVFRVDNSRIVSATGHDLPPLAQRIEEHAAEARAEV